MESKRREGVKVGTLMVDIARRAGLTNNDVAALEQAMVLGRTEKPAERESKVE